MPFMALYDPFSPTFDHPLLNSSPDYTPRNGSFRSRPIGEFVPQSTFRERNKRLRELDDEKNQLIEELLFHLESTESRFKQLQLDHTRDAQYNRDAHLRETSLQDQLQRVKIAMDRNAFLIALIDGDAMLFTDELLSRGEPGGKEAATALSNALYSFASEHLGHLESPKLVARIYANFTSLSDTLVRHRIIDKPSIFYEFVTGFNSTKLLFDLVDAGTKQNGVQNKLREMLRLQMYDCHCHQVLFGCSSSSEYVPVLEEVQLDSDVRDHVTLLEACPFENGLTDLQSQFKTVRFDEVFRTTGLAPLLPLPKPPPAVAAALPALTRVESNKTSGGASSANTPQMNWATVTAQAQITPVQAVRPVASRTTTPSSTTTAESISKLKTSNKSIDKNRLGMRIDRVDKDIPNYEIQRVKKLKLCNTYYLQGKELCSANKCTHRHDYPISNYERKILREVSRMTPCYYKTDCDDADCIYGHRCPQSKPGEQGCYYGEDCRFYGWGHGIDVRLCKTIKV